MFDGDRLWSGTWRACGWWRPRICTRPCASSARARRTRSTRSRRRAASSRESRSRTRVSVPRCGCLRGAPGCSRSRYRIPRGDRARSIGAVGCAGRRGLVRARVAAVPRPCDGGARRARRAGAGGGVAGATGRVGGAVLARDAVPVAARGGGRAVLGSGVSRSGIRGGGGRSGLGRAALPRRAGPRVLGYGTAGVAPGCIGSRRRLARARWERDRRRAPRHRRRARRTWTRAGG